MLKKVFQAHPETVGETYFEHLQSALGFAVTFFVSGLKVLLHAFIPCLFVEAGSKSVQRLHDDMICNRNKQARSIERS